MSTLTVTCPVGFTESVVTAVGGSSANPGWGQVSLRCTGPVGSGAASNYLPPYVSNQGCPADFPPCGASGPSSVSDTVILCSAVIGAWVMVWCVRIVRRVF